VQERTVDVAVVGAGLAGLVAARALVAAGRTVAVLEARDRVGGRVCNVPLSDGSVVEVGGQWIGPGQDRVAALAAELGVDTFPTFEEGDRVLSFKGRVGSGPDGPRIPKAALVDLGRAHSRLDRMAATVPVDAPWTWIRRNVVTRSARELLRVAVAAVFAAEPGDMSLLHFLFYVHSGGSLARLLDTSGGAQESRVVGGSQLLALRMAESLADGVALAAPVRRIHHEPDRVGVVADGVTVVARRAIVAVPPVLAARIAFVPALPPHRDQLMQRMPMGSVIKVMAVYDEPFWRGDGLSGQATADSGPIRVTFDNSPPDSPLGVLLGFVEGQDARQLTLLTDEERRMEVLNAFEHFFGPKAARPEEYIERDWSREEWTRGCYGAHLPPGTWTQYGPTLREPCGPIHWAGTETAEVWSGYMDGAVRSGERAAAEVLGAIR